MDRRVAMRKTPQLGGSKAMAQQEGRGHRKR